MKPKRSVNACRIVCVRTGTKDGLRGGVQLVSQELATSAADAGMEATEVESGDVDSLLRDSCTRTLIYVQQQGRLSPEYLARVKAWLDLGAVVLEKNVFALPSAWRPRHPRYVMALMSMDGAYRYSLRSRAALHQRQSTFALVPNPTLHGGRIHRRETSGRTGQLHLLRVGRPDLGKWSNFEIDFARSLAQHYARLQIRLTLVGFPGELPGWARDGRLPNLQIRSIPYSNDLSELYRDADAYVHYSRIGETYGNTLAEATACRLPIILALNPAWDTAPLEFINTGSSSVGSVRSILADPGMYLRSASSRVKTANTQVFSGHTMSFLERITRVADEAGDACLPVPSVREAILHLEAVTERILGSRTPATAVVSRETCRAIRNRWKRDGAF